MNTISRLPIRLNWNFPPAVIATFLFALILVLGACQPIIDPSLMEAPVSTEAADEAATEGDSSSEEAATDAESSDAATDDANADDANADDAVESDSPLAGLGPAQATVSTRSLWVRESPADDAEGVAGIKQGETYLVIGISSDGEWLQLEIPDAPDGVGWVATEFLILEGDITNIEIVEVATEEVASTDETASDTTDDATGETTEETDTEANTDAVAMADSTDAESDTADDTSTDEAATEEASAEGETSTEADTEAADDEATTEAAADETVEETTSESETPADESAVTEEDAAAEDAAAEDAGTEEAAEEAESDTGDEASADGEATEEATEDATEETATEENSTEESSMEGTEFVVISTEGIPLRVRSAPTTEEDNKIGNVFDGETYAVLGVSEDGLWYLIDVPQLGVEEGGWISAEFAIPDAESEGDSG